MNLNNKQFLNLLKDLIQEEKKKRNVLLETPQKKKTIREKMKDIEKTRQA